MIASYLFSSELETYKGWGYQADLGYKFNVRKIRDRLAGQLQELHVQREQRGEARDPDEADLYRSLLCPSHSILKLAPFCVEK